MRIYGITVVGRSIEANSDDMNLIRTSIGVDQLHVLFDSDEWLNFPIAVTFKNANVMVSMSLVVAAIESTEWAAEATCTIPWEVIQELGSINVTLQGTDSSGNHIITAEGAPLAVIEAGDVESGSIPEGVPTVNEWQQAYANAMAAASDAASAANDAESAADQVSDILYSTDAQTMEELLEQLGNAFRLQGTVSTFSNLPTDAIIGDTYIVSAPYLKYPSGTYFTWTGTSWEAISGLLDINNISEEEINRIIANADEYLDYDDGLPSGVKRLEYIISSHEYYSEIGDIVSYIDTGIPANTPNLLFEVKYKNNVLADGFIFGDSSVRNALTFGALRTLTERQQQSYTDNDNIVFRYGDGDSFIAEYVVSRNGEHVVSLKSGVGMIDGVSYTDVPSTGTLSSNTIKLGSDRAAFEYNERILRGNIYYAKAWSGNTLILDLIPVYADDEACMYNRVSGELFKSESAHKFGAGPEMSTWSFLGQSGLARVWLAVEDAISGGSYTLPTMSATTKGGAKLGSGLKLDSDALSLGGVVTDSHDGPIYSVDAQGWAEQDGTPTPENPVEIRVARGRNLLDESIRQSGYTDSTSHSVFPSSVSSCYMDVPIDPSTDYTLSWDYVSLGSTNTREMVFYTESLTKISSVYYQPNASSKSYSFTTPSNAKYVCFTVDNGMTSTQLELGSTPTPYVPYGCVGLDIYDANNAHVSTVPIPLPSKGFAASLPDGTADALAVDSAGKWEWECPTNEVVFDGTENWSYNANSNFAFTAKPTDGGDFGTGSSSAGKFLLDRFLVVGGGAAGTAYASGANILFWCGGAYSPTSSAEAKAWATANPITLLYPLATPTTEHGYIPDWPVDIPEGATITIPELEDVGVRCFVAGAKELVEHAANWGHRNQEMETRLAALEAQVAELATA